MSGCPGRLETDAIDVGNVGFVASHASMDPVAGEVVAIPVLGSVSKNLADSDSVCGTFMLLRVQP